VQTLEQNQPAAANDFQLNWRKLQQMGLNAYEARSYLVLMGHPRFKALELAARSHVPRQKIYEVLDSLVEKGFAQVVQEKTKMFSAIAPNLAIPGYLARRNEELQHQLAEQGRAARGLLQDLSRVYTEGREGQGKLDFLHLVNDPTQAASHYRRMLSEARSEYCELLRQPFAVNPLGEDAVLQAAARGVQCRLLIESGASGEEQWTIPHHYTQPGIEIRFFEKLPLKLALFDNRCGLIALPDPVLTKLSWTAVVFDHTGFSEAMSGLFESYWVRAQENPGHGWSAAAG
jgi:HTH-type transcriptional regulator, sugar sensing transcriptional regulator